MEMGKKVNNPGYVYAPYIISITKSEINVTSEFAHKILLHSVYGAFNDDFIDKMDKLIESLEESQLID
jgi:hypothetical protein